MRRLLRRFGGCQRGAAALEFALVAPMLILLHLGTVETIDTWEAYRRVAHIAAALADLTAQNRSVAQPDLDDIMKAGDVMILPYPSGMLGERISSLSADSSGAVTTDWSVQRAWTQGGAASVPAGYLQPGESVIVADVTFKTQALFGLVMPKSLTMQSHAYVRPRLSNQVLKG
jgi:Flp pilus assembly protein TadG